jgi:hypothetical protein
VEYFSKILRQLKKEDYFMLTWNSGIKQLQKNIDLGLTICHDEAVRKTLDRVGSP